MKINTTMRQILFHFGENGVYLKKTKDQQMTNGNVERRAFLQNSQELAQFNYERSPYVDSSDYSEWSIYQFPTKNSPRK